MLKEVKTCGSHPPAGLCGVSAKTVFGAAGVPHSPSCIDESILSDVQGISSRMLFYSHGSSVRIHRKSPRGWKFRRIAQWVSDMCGIKISLHFICVSLPREVRDKLMKVISEHQILCITLLLAACFLTASVRVTPPEVWSTSRPGSSCT